jgi:acyl-CoA synthetase (AMP-forming)/AMP-acid ligase II
VLDRTKDMINRGGTKIFSAEVEELLRRHPAIEDAAVVGVPGRAGGRGGGGVRRGERAGDRRAGARVGAGGAWPTTPRPRRSSWSTRCPRNAVGKTDKQALRERARPA